MRKKICFVTTISATIKSFLIEYSKYLTEERDYDVTFICDTDESMYGYCNENIHYIPVKMRRGLKGIFTDYIRATYQLYRIFKSEKYDIVQYSTKNAGNYAPMAAWLAGIKCRLYCQWGMMFVAMKGLKRITIKIDEKLIACLSTVIEVESFSILEQGIQEGIYTKEKASVIWNGSACGVNLDKYLLENKPAWREAVRQEYGINDTATVFGYCGRITRDKGLNELFGAFKCIVESKTFNNDAYLMIIGAYDNVETIDPGLFAWAKACPFVIFTGFTNNVPRYYSALDVFCSLSYREGFGLVVIEAAAMAVPGIVTDVPGQRDTIEHLKTGYSVPSHDVDHVVEAMHFYINKNLATKSMGINARKAVEDKYEQKELFKQMTDHRDSLIIR